MVLRAVVAAVALLAPLPPAHAQFLVDPEAWAEGWGTLVAELPEGTLIVDLEASNDHISLLVRFPQFPDVTGIIAVRPSDTALREGLVVQPARRVREGQTMPAHPFALEELPLLGAPAPALAAAMQRAEAGRTGWPAVLRARRLASEGSRPAMSAWRSAW